MSKNHWRAAGQLGFARANAPFTSVDFKLVTTGNSRRGNFGSACSAVL